MRKIAGPIRVELAQYRELAAFAQFGSDLDKDTLERLRQGERIIEVLKQPQYKPMPVEQQVLILYVLTSKLLRDVELNQVVEFENQFLKFVETKYSEILSEIKTKKEITKEVEPKIKEAVEKFKNDFSKR